MNSLRQVALCTLAPAAFAVAACAPLFGGPKPVDVRPVETNTTDNGTPDDALYRSAAAAIGDRDYLRALDYLQAAREKQPQDVRVLNAFGVVYDKLGRFDLSSRYYAQAKALDPKSTIVAGNIAYSQLLQGLRKEDVSPVKLASKAPDANASLSPNNDGGARASAEANKQAPAPVIRPTSVLEAVKPEEVAAVIPKPELRYAPDAQNIPIAAAPTPAAPAPAPPDRIAAAPVVNSESPEAVTVQPAPSPIERSAAGPVVTPRFAGTAGVPPASVQSERFVTTPVVTPESPETASVPPAPASAERIAAVPIVTPKSPGSAGVPPASAQAEQIVMAPVATSKSLGTAITRPISAQAEQPCGRDARGQGNANIVCPAAPSPHPLLTGRPLVILNASGRKDATEGLRLRLVHLGWTAPRSSMRDTASQHLTSLYYPQRFLTAARGLARTLRLSVLLALRTCNCGGLELVVGADVLNRFVLPKDGIKFGSAALPPTKAKRNDHGPAKT